MAKTTIIKLTDDIDGTEASESLIFSLDGKTYEIDLSKENATSLRKAFAPYVEKARPIAAPGRRTRQAASATDRPSAPTLFSQLNSEEKDKFRAWVNMPKARRIADKRVQEWLDAGKP